MTQNEEIGEMGVTNKRARYAHIQSKVDTFRHLGEQSVKGNPPEVQAQSSGDESKTNELWN